VPPSPKPAAQKPRANFPIFEQLIHANPLSFLDSPPGSQKPAQVLAEAAQAVGNGRPQLNLKAHQQGEDAAAALAYLIGMSDGLPVPLDGALEPIDLVDVSAPIDVLIRQAQENGPGVRELQGLAGSIQNSIAEARFAQCLCDRTGAATICGRLHMAQSQLQQANLALLDVQGKLRAGVEEAVAAILSGREQIASGASAIQHAAESYRLMDAILTEGPEAARRSNSTFSAVLSSIQQLNQAHANYLLAVSAYNKAQVRLLLLIGTRINYVIGHLAPPRFNASARLIQVDIDPSEIGVETCW